MKQQVNYCIVLSAERLKFLAESKYGIDRMKILHQLIRSVSLKETEYNIKGFHTTIHVGQAAISEVELSNRLRYDKKTISRLLDQMNQLGIVATEQSNRTSVHTLKCISLGWWTDNAPPILSMFRLKTDRLLNKSMREMPVKTSRR